MAKLTKSYFESGEGRESVRINKYLSDAGMCSRREADKLVEAGKVLIDGETAEMGSKVLPGQKVTLQGKDIEKEEKMILIAFHKPQGIVCTTDRREPDNIIDFINFGSRIFPIGRLDKDSEGLILLTNDGEIVNKILRAGNHHEKEYMVQVNKPLTAAFLKGMAGGVPILDTVTKPCLVEEIDKTTFRIVLTQGLNRQIRRMCEYFDYRVVSLKRIRIMNVNLGRLQKGGYRNLTEWELEELNLMIQESSNQPFDEKDEDFLPEEGVVISKHIPTGMTPKQAAKAERFRKPADGRRKAGDSRRTSEKKPFEKKPFEKKPFEKKSFEKKPFEKKSFEKKPFERMEKESNFKRSGHQEKTDYKSDGTGQKGRKPAVKGVGWTEKKKYQETGNEKGFEGGTYKAKGSSAGYRKGQSGRKSTGHTGRRSVGRPGAGRNK